MTGDRAELLLIDVVGGWALVGAGIVAYLHQRDPRVGLLMFAAGFAWLVAGLRWSDSSSVAQTTGLASSWLWAAILAHLALAFPGGRLEGRFERALVIAAYVIAVPGRLTWMVLADQRVTFMNEPLVHPVSCESCPSSFLATGWAPGVAEALRWVEQVAVVLVAIGVIGMLAVHWRRGTAVARRALAPLVGVGAATAIVLAAGTAAGAAGHNDAGRAIEWMWDACVVALPLAFLAGVLRMRLRGAAGLARTLEELDGLPGDGDVATVLARALGDPSLELVYWLPEGERYVDRDGHASAVPAGVGRAVTPIELQGRRIGALVHDPSLLHEPDVVRAAGRTAALWIERARLEAERNARLVELRASRARLVEAGDLERRRIERDLHDGAQQRLAGLLLQTKLRRRAGSAPVEAEALLDDLEQGLAQALAELRALAAGILPPVLSDHGLAAALEELAARSPVPVVVDADDVGRVDSRAEAAAYFVVAESVTNVIKHAHAERVVARVTRDDGHVLIEVADDGVGGASVDGGTGLRGLVDRVAALDGTLTWTSPAGAGTVVRAEIPCAS
jgi:signal transduction histidine kinase